MNPSMKYPNLQKTVLMMVALVASLALNGRADAVDNPPCVSPPPGMISWWPGEGNADDIIGAPANNGTLVGGVTFATGEVGRAFRFNGRDYVEVPASPSLNLPQITIDAWIFANAPGVGTVPRIFSWAADAFEIGDYFNTGRLGVWLPSLGWQDTGFLIRTNTWVHIAVTHDGTTLRVYGNGALIPGASYAAPISLNNGPIRFGNRVNCIGVCEAFVGLVDEAELFGRALEEREIEAIYEAGHSGKCKPCVQAPSGFTLWLPFDEISGTTSANLYLGGNNGTHIQNPGVTNGYVDHGLCFNGTNQGVTVPDYAAINPGTGDLSIDAWVRRSSESGNGTRTIVDKRTPGIIKGYSLAINTGHLLFQLATSGGFTTYTDTGTLPADNQWHFIAVTVNRTSTTGGKFYIDGAPTGTFNPTNRPGNLNNTGAFNVAFSQLSGSARWLGCIDEVEFFPRMLFQDEIRKIYDAGSGGKCKSTVIQGSCAPSSSLCALVSGPNVIAYVPKGCWQCSAPGVAVVNVEGNSITNTTISTGTDVINSCAANAITGQVVCTANNNMVYVFIGTALDPSVLPLNPFPSGAMGTIQFSGGTCTNCGVAMDATHNRAVIAMSTLTPPIGLVGGFQFLTLPTATLGNVFASEAPTPGGPYFLANISEDALIDPIRNLLLSANENNNYELIDVAPAPSPNPFYEMPMPNLGLADSSGEDCSTGIALAPYEGSAPSQVLLTDLNSAVFIPGPPGLPGSWTSSCSSVNTLTESFLSAGSSGIAVAQGTHTGIVSGEFGDDAITAIALPPTSGVCVLPDWLSCNIGGGFMNGLDPHTVTAYRSPNAPNHAFAVLANGNGFSPPTTLAVVDLTNMLNPFFVPRTSGTGLGHACASTPLPPTVVSFIPVP
jgi:Concanavalin A-like lectin/glucanases superfamily